MFLMLLVLVGPEEMVAIVHSLQCASERELAGWPPLEPSPYLMGLLLPVFHICERLGPEHRAREG
jgi:hypothetical protein